MATFACTSRGALARTRLRAQEFLLTFLKDGPRTTLEIWNAAQPLGLSRSTLDRARAALEIKTQRINIGTPMQTSYWRLPGQQVPGHPDKDAEFDKIMAHLKSQYVERTPLDDDYVRPSVEVASEVEDDDESEI